MTTTNWRALMVRWLLVLGLVAGPWPAAIAAAPFLHAPATEQTRDEAPCPMDGQQKAQAPCHCCDDGAACSAMHCMLSTPAPGLPVVAASFEKIHDGATRGADRFTRSPEPRPGERLRPPIA